MPGYVIHIAIAKEYIRKHKEIKDDNSFILGAIAPDLTENKKETHYGKSPAYTNLSEYLRVNTIEESYDKGFFLHLITDYLFYNSYLEYYDKKMMYHDYDVLNEALIKKYDIHLPENIKDKVFYIKGKTKILNYESVIKMIEEISNYDLDVIKKEVEARKYKMEQI